VFTPSNGSTGWPGGGGEDDDWDEIDESDNADNDPPETPQERAAKMENFRLWNLWQRVKPKVIDFQELGRTGEKAIISDGRTAMRASQRERWRVFSPEGKLIQTLADLSEISKMPKDFKG